MDYYLDFVRKIGTYWYKVGNQFILLQGKERTEWRKCKWKAQPLSTDCAGETFLCDAPYLSVLSLSIKHKKCNAFFKCLNYTLFYLSMQMQSLLAIATHSWKCSCQNPPPHFSEINTFSLKLLWPLIERSPLCILFIFLRWHEGHNLRSLHENLPIFSWQFCSHSFLSVCAAVYIHLSINLLIHIFLSASHPSYYVHPFMQVRRDS